MRAFYSMFVPYVYFLCFYINPVCGETQLDFTSTSHKQDTKNMDSQNLHILLRDIEHFSKTHSLKILEELQIPFHTTLVEKDKPLRLQAIINHKALINDTWLTQNQSVQGYVLLSIHTHSVVVQKNGIRSTLKLSTQGD